VVLTGAHNVNYGYCKGSEKGLKGQRDGGLDGYWKISGSEDLYNKLGADSADGIRAEHRLMPKTAFVVSVCIEMVLQADVSSQYSR